MRYLFRGLIRETGKTVEGAVEADSPEEALNALSANGIVTEDLTPAPLPIDAYRPSDRAGFAPASAGRAGAPPAPPGSLDGGDAIEGGARPVGGANDFVRAQNIPHPDAGSDDELDRAFAAASQAVNFDQVAQRYKGKSVWVIDRDKIRRQVASVVDNALKKAEQSDQTGDHIRESVASALKQLFKDNRNIASEKTPEQAKAEQRAAQGGGGGGTAMAVSTPQLEALTGRLEEFLSKAETVLTQLQVAARRVGTGGGGGAGFGPRRMSHIPRPRSEEQNSVLMEIFKSNVKLRDNLKGGGSEYPEDAEAQAAEVDAHATAVAEAVAEEEPASN